MAILAMASHGQDARATMHHAMSDQAAVSLEQNEVPWRNRVRILVADFQDVAGPD